MDRTAAWAAVADERRALADLLAGVDPAAWRAPSRCGSWEVRYVVAHLVFLAEGTRWSIIRTNALAHPLPNKANDKVARRIAEAATPEELTTRLRDAAGGRFVVPGLPPTVALGEVVVHRADIADAAGLPAHAADERLQAVLEAETRLWWAFGAPRAVRRIRFEPTDGDWSVGPPDGQPAQGPGEQLLLAATGRRGVAAGLTGEGAALLAT